MQQSFAACFAFTREEEGGLSVSPSDPGNYISGIAGDGALIGSNCGISAGELDAWMTPDAITAQDMAGLDAAIIEAIYRAGYWLPTACDALPAGVELMVMDFGFNAGIGPSGRVLQQCAGLTGKDVDGWIGGQTLAAIPNVQNRSLIDLVDADAMHGLQQVLGITADGVIGPQTQKAIAAHSNSAMLLLITAMTTKQSAHYRALADFKTFGAGWLARTQRRQMAAFALALT